VWWFGTIFALAAAVLFGLVVDVPHRPKAGEATASSTSPRWGQMLLTPSTWLLALAFATLSFCLIGYNTWAPFFLTETLRVAGATASFYASLLFLAGIPGNIAAGWLLNRISNRYRLLSLAFLLTAILFAWSFRLGSVGTLVPYMVLLGFVSNFAPTSIFTLAPETMGRAEYAGLSMAVILVGSSVGVLLGPPLMGSALSGGRWALGSVYLVAVTAVGFVATLVAARRQKPVKTSGV
jgi:sugar phosphate permease